MSVLILYGVNMLKKALLVLAVLLLASSISATVFMHKPVEEKVSDGGVVELGRVAKGQTIVIVIERKSEKSYKWNDIGVGAVTLPQGWAYYSKVLDETIELDISVPKNAPSIMQRLNVTALNSSQPENFDTFGVNVNVVDPSSVFVVGIDLNSRDMNVNATNPFSITINNNSISRAEFVLGTTFPEKWLGQYGVMVVEPGEVKVFEYSLTPTAYGKKNGVIFVNSAQNDFSVPFDIELNVYPTVVGKFQAPFFGMPFFSISLWPEYLINAFLSFLSG